MDRFDFVVTEIPGWRTDATRLAEGVSRQLTFELRSGNLVDEQTGSAWDEFGTAVRGPLVGARLPRLVMDTPYWFAAAGFATDLRIWEP